MSAVRADAKEVERARRREERGTRRRGILGLAWRPATALAVGVLLVAGLVTGWALRGGGEDPVLVEAVPASPAAPGSLAATLEVAEDGEGTLVVEELPPLPSDRVYQAWIDRDGRIEPSTPFVVDRDGEGTVAIEGSLQGADGVYVTREPDGGSTEPTLPILLEAPLSS